MRKTWFLLTCRNDEGQRLRQRVISGTVVGFSGGYYQRFDKPQVCHGGESISVSEICMEEVICTPDLDFIPLTGAEAWKALYEN